MTGSATTQDTADVRMPEDIPPHWANSFMKWVLRTPVLQSWVGGEVALLTFTGRRSGTSYTIPVSYHRDGDTVTVVTKRARNWWRNFESPAEVELRLAGHVYTGKAEAKNDHDESLEFMTEFLKQRPIDGKAYGLAKDEMTKDKIARIVPYIVLIRIEIAQTELGREETRLPGTKS